MNIRFIYLSVVAVLFVLIFALFMPAFLWLYLIVLPLIVVGFMDMRQASHSIRRNFPLFGRGRWVMEAIRPFIRQYLIESDTDEAPISRVFRNVIYQRAKGERDTVPFGTKFDVYRVGYEWIGHSLSAINIPESAHDLRVTVGGSDCKQPYSSSILNISAMSFGALSGNAIASLNLGAKLGGFSHNTGEGGLSPYHLLHGGDLVWQIGTAYFGCRDEQGRFSEALFAQKAQNTAVKMIEIKLSQGAKPGHGGILPADKNTPEIAEIRGVKAHTQVNSPPTHSEFDSPLGLLHFVARLRALSGGKPVGFKLTIGRPSEFVGICKAMRKTGICPDFITVDGAEGGTGAAPLEYANSIGMPLRDAVAFVSDCLVGFDLKKEVKIIASGKVIAGFHLVKNFALGADICNNARANMLALGCVQSLICNTNRCPTGVATQDSRLAQGLVVEDKSKRVFRYHKATVKATAEIIASAGLSHTNEVNRSHIFRRVSAQRVSRYDEIFPYLKTGDLLGDNIPDHFKLVMNESTAERFSPEHCLTCIDEKIEAKV